MIVAELRVEHSDGTRYLAGKTCVNWELKKGTMLVLRKQLDGRYLLMELGERDIRFSHEGVLSFCDEDGE